MFAGRPKTSPMNRPAVLPVLFHLLWGRRLVGARWERGDGRDVPRQPEHAGAMEQGQGGLVTVRSPVLAAGLLGGLSEKEIRRPGRPGQSRCPGGFW
jgi:hypothetical protein